MRNEMKSCIYDQFQLDEQIKRNQNLRTEKIKVTKKIKRIKIEIKTSLYNQF